MIADLFRKDYRQMTAQGVKFTPEDIVLLNALAIKVRLTQNTARTAHLPRLAFLPKMRAGLLTAFQKEVVLREPTIAHEMWLEQATRYIKMDCDRAFDLLHGYALAHPAEKLPDVFDPKRLIRKVFTWCARHLAHLTREQLSSAVDYCLFGADWTAGERGPAQSTKHQSPSTGEGVASPTIGLLTEARALRLPISLDDAKRMTASELDEAITRCLAKDHKIDYDAERHHAMGEYVRARNAIRKRSEANVEELHDA
ncbi:MAG: hypothetical protein IKB76_07160 [Kiritimatiellae bacterium]|nr:hypothetical protein [Kiritimatiellia bacterium]